MKKPVRGSSLQLFLTGLITLLVLLTAFSLGYFYDRAMQRQLISAQHQLFNYASNQVAANIRENGARAEVITDLIAHSGLASAHSDAQRAIFIPQLVATLQANPALQAVYMGYDNGDFFLVRRLDAAAKQALSDAPPLSIWVVQYAHQQPNGQTLQRFEFLSSTLENVGQWHTDVHYDPRQRPWYQAASHANAPIQTPPYTFATTRQPGVTYARKGKSNGGIAGADVLLITASQVLTSNRPSQHAQLALVDATHNTLLSTISQTAGKSPAPLSRLDSPPLAALGQTWLPGRHPPATVTVAGEQWHVSASQLRKASDGQGLYLAMVMPDAELLAESQAIARQAAWGPAIILLLMLPLGWLLARFLIKPIQQLVLASERIRSMDFTHAPLPHTQVRELNDLIDASESMKVTIRDFIGLSRQIISENALEPLLKMVLETTMRALSAEHGGLWLHDGKQLSPSASHDQDGKALTLGPLALDNSLVRDSLASVGAPLQLTLSADQTPPAIHALLIHEHTVLTLLPLQLESKELLGLLVLSSESTSETAAQIHRLSYMKALASFAAIAIDNRRLVAAQQALMNALVELIAGAIDAKSPYTGGHCQRVPEIAQALAEAAHQATEGPFANFTLSPSDREALYIASWLHDCGKVTTPEYVVDKPTKLQTLYDRLHEIRMRFEVLKRDADIVYWRGVAAGGNASVLAVERDALKAQLDDDFRFVARCNQGGEFMRDEDLERLRQIAERQWTRTLDDRIGLGPIERIRLRKLPAPTLPVQEPLLADKPEHCIARRPGDHIPANNRWGFNMKEPELLQNLGELYNLSIRRGTLTDEERYIINEHITETIKMLTALPFPQHLAQVPEIAGGHHERMDGKGYPRGLKGSDMSIMARIMAIADVFEALTASDRPYKPAKTLSEALAIMQYMVADQHLDGELFQLFLQSGLWHSYSALHLSPEQRDVDDIAGFLDTKPGPTKH
ncbi:MAG TPA: HD domain-containing phosphohydrolase [Chromobacteriaceae bacterium]|nr:HD domain-containing phosphohydrolase [Chromobacteriaceae bacterium]